MQNLLFSNFLQQDPCCKTFSSLIFCNKTLVAKITTASPAAANFLQQDPCCKNCNNISRRVAHLHSRRSLPPFRNNAVVAETCLSTAARLMVLHAGVADLVGSVDPVGGEAFGGGDPAWMPSATTTWAGYSSCARAGQSTRRLGLVVRACRERRSCCLLLGALATGVRASRGHPEVGRRCC